MSLLGGIGNFIGSVFGIDGSPTRQVANLDDTTKQMIDAYADRGLRSEAEIKKEGYGLADEAAAQVGAPKEVGGYNPMMGDAIRMKYQEAAQKDLGKLKLMSDMQAKQDKAQQMRTGWEMLMAKQNVETQNFARAAEARMQSEALRAQVLSSVFQTAGRVAGAYYGSQTKGFKPQPMQGAQAEYTGGWSQPQTPPTPEMDYSNYNPVV